LRGVERSVALLPLLDGAEPCCSDVSVADRLDLRDEVLLAEAVEDAEEAVEETDHTRVLPLEEGVEVRDVEEQYGPGSLVLLQRDRSVCNIKESFLRNLGSRAGGRSPASVGAARC